MKDEVIVEFSKKFEMTYQNALEKGECLRLFHGRGGCFPELDFFNVDLYPPAIFVSVFKENDFEDIKEEILKVIGKDTPLVIQKRYLKPIERETYGAELKERIVCKEDGLNFSIDLHNNQNPGLFLDMKNGKKWIKENSHGKSILNLFSYTCSVSVYALAAGALNVLNIDQKKTFLNIGRENHRINNLDGVSEYRNWDVKKSINQIGKKGPFDIMFCDPPSNQGKSFYYKTDYSKIIQKASKLLKKGGYFVACLNTPFEKTEFIHNMFKDDSLNWEFISTLHSSSDYSEIDKEEGLKICVYRLN